MKSITVRISVRATETSRREETHVLVDDLRLRRLRVREATDRTRDHPSYASLLPLVVREANAQCGSGREWEALSTRDRAGREKGTSATPVNSFDGRLTNGWLTKGTNLRKVTTGKWCTTESSPVKNNTANRRHPTHYKRKSHFRANRVRKTTGISVIVFLLYIALYFD